MNVVYHEKAKQGEGYALLQKATEQLKTELEPNGNRVQAEWDRVEDERGRPVYSLKLWYVPGEPDEAEARFAPEDLKNSDGVTSRLKRLWRTLLRERENRLWRELQAAAGSEN